MFLYAISGHEAESRNLVKVMKSETKMEKKKFLTAGYSH